MAEDRRYLNVVFAGTPPFAAVALEALIAAQITLPIKLSAVYTQPDRPAGRGQKLQSSAVKQVALAHGIAVLQPKTLRESVAQDELRALAPDLMIVAAYGLILPQAVLDIPRLGCLNIHGSLLPRWRGAAPIQRAIEAGDSETGVGIMRMEAGLDTGAVLHELRTPISEIDTAGSVHDRLAQLGAQALIAVLGRLTRGEVVAEIAQTHEGIMYAHKITPEHAQIDWTLPAAQVARKIRAFNPVPGCSAKIGDESVKIWAAKPIALQGEAGQILRASGNALIIACGQDALQIIEIQRPGGKRLNAAAYIAGILRKV